MRTRSRQSSSVRTDVHPVSDPLGAGHVETPAQGMASDPHPGPTDNSLLTGFTTLAQQRLIDAAPAIMWIKDTNSRFLIANTAAARQIGYSDPARMIGKDDFELHPSGTAQKYFADEQNLLRSGQDRLDREERVVDAYGRETWISTTKAPLRDQNGEIIGIIGVSHDITQRRLADQLRDGQAKLFELIAIGASLDVILDMIVRTLEAQMPFVHGIAVCIAAKQELGAVAAPSFDRHHQALIKLACVSAGQLPLGAVLRTGRAEAGTGHDDPLMMRRNPKGALSYRSSYAVPIVAQSGGTLGALSLYCSSLDATYVANSQLVTTLVRIAAIAIERQQAEDRFKHLATHDALTGLPNRSLIAERLSRAVETTDLSERSVAIVLVDLDNFKMVNDRMGHSAGDELLKNVATRMLDSLRSTDSVIRLGGDEFVVILADALPSRASIDATLRLLAGAISEPMQLAGGEVSVNCSLGVALYPQDGTDLSLLLLRADTAMYDAKKHGRNGIRHYSRSKRTRAA